VVEIKTQTLQGMGPLAVALAEHQAGCLQLLMDKRDLLILEAVVAVA
jgi:hypothetical protein